MISVLSCPKCGGRMRESERSGIVLEQCEDCRGIFLDRGELERFIEAEGGGWSGRVGAPGDAWRLGPEATQAVPGFDDRRRPEEQAAALRDLLRDDD